ncbi:LytTR family DNA-binding domain-containing protein [uncultured Polaribacter sp.]|uniref:LytR/AlgR family response regulator transcription factor n=1 Tax=uncultured Polaribacter sp. TaxID=174711 RepID=UPI002621FE4A|nr:LytTR family DNA-binding domain-containing protein [uncultured Polaribacter sp.]
MKHIKAILVDDEISNLKGLEKKLHTLFPDIIILEKFQEPEAAIKKLNSTVIDILFLDIQMPRINGFELLSAIKNINFQIIFVTAYSEFALDAFKNNAIDYILKPVDNNELKAAVNKALENLKLQKEQNNFDKLSKLISENMAQNNKIIVPTQNGISFLNEDEVLHLEGYQGYTKIHLQNNTILTSSYNLGKFEKTIGPKFFKCHKSHIINLQKVRHLENEGYLILDNEIVVPISKANKKLFLNLFN